MFDKLKGVKNLLTKTPKTDEKEKGKKGSIEELPSDNPSKTKEQELREKVISMLETIYDPEIPVNIYRLGLIYNIDFSQEEGKVQCDIEMTLTSPACPVAESLVEQVYNIAYIIDEIDELKVDLVFEPPWTPDKMSYEAKLELGLL